MVKICVCVCVCVCVHVRQAYFGHRRIGVLLGADAPLDPCGALPVEHTGVTV